MRIATQTARDAASTADTPEPVSTGFAAITSQLRIARRRMAWIGALQSLVYGAAAALAAFCVLLADGWLRTPHPLQRSIVVGTVAGTLTALAYFWSRWHALPSAAGLARSADQTLGLRERVSTALDVSTGDARMTSVSRVLLQETVRRAGLLEPARLAPVGLPRAAWSVLPLAALATLLLFLPPLAGDAIESDPAAPAGANPSDRSLVFVPGPTDAAAGTLSDTPPALPVVGLSEFGSNAGSAPTADPDDPRQPLGSQTDPNTPGRPAGDAIAPPDDAQTSDAGNGAADGADDDGQEPSADASESPDENSGESPAETPGAEAGTGEGGADGGDTGAGGTAGGDEGENQDENGDGQGDTEECLDAGCAGVTGYTTTISRLNERSPAPGTEDVTATRNATDPDAPATSGLLVAPEGAEDTGLAGTMGAGNPFGLFDLILWQNVEPELDGEMLLADRWVGEGRRIVLTAPPETGGQTFSEMAPGAVPTQAVTAEQGVDRQWLPPHQRDVVTRYFTTPAEPAP